MKIATFFFEGNKYAKLYNYLYGGNAFYKGNCNRITYMSGPTHKDRGYNGRIRDYIDDDYMNKSPKVVHFYEVKGKLYAQSRENLFKKMNKHV